MHQRIGILGGMTAESTVTYYLHIVRAYQREFGDHGYPEIVIDSLSFQQLEDWMESDRWDLIQPVLGQGLERLAAAGAQFAVMATNTMHLFIEQLRQASPIPIVSIVDATASAVKKAGLQTIGLLGTRFTMEKPFYADGLAAHGIRTVIPDPDERGVIHQVIMQELSRGDLRDESRRKYLGIIDRLVARGAQGAVLGCTEIPLLVRPEDTRVPLFDTATIHADAALRRAISETC